MARKSTYPSPLLFKHYGQQNYDTKKIQKSNVKLQPQPAKQNMKCLSHNYTRFKRSEISSLTKPKSKPILATGVATCCNML